MWFHIYKPAVLTQPWEFIISCQWHYTEGILYCKLTNTCSTSPIPAIGNKINQWNPIMQYLHTQYLVLKISTVYWPKKSHNTIFAHSFRILNVSAVIHVVHTCFQEIPPSLLMKTLACTPLYRLSPTLPWARISPGVSGFDTIPGMSNLFLLYVWWRFKVHFWKMQIYIYNHFHFVHNLNNSNTSRNYLINLLRNY